MMNLNNFAIKLRYWKGKNTFESDDFFVIYLN